jgi:hypothetical protein
MCIVLYPHSYGLHHHSHKCKSSRRGFALGCLPFGASHALTWTGLVISFVLADAWMHVYARAQLMGKRHLHPAKALEQCTDAWLLSQPQR